jgi:hypothetical protein
VPHAEVSTDSVLAGALNDAAAYQRYGIAPLQPTLPGRLTAAADTSSVPAMCAGCLVQVASEDTVLYTAQAYVDKLKGASLDSADIQLVGSKLAAPVRAPQLSLLWRAASALADNASRADAGWAAEDAAAADAATQHIAGASKSMHCNCRRNRSNHAKCPASWVHGPRTDKKVGSVCV